MSAQCMVDCALLETLCNSSFLSSLMLGNSSNSSDTSHISRAEAYGYGGLMVLIISLLSLLGVALLPFMQRNSRLSVIYKHLIAILIAMGAAALVSDALIHLIPGALGNHQHGEVGEHDETTDERAVIWKMCGVLAGMVSFFVLELLLHTCFKQFGHTHSHVVPNVSRSISSSDSVALIHKKHNSTHPNASGHGMTTDQTSNSEYGAIHSNVTPIVSQGGCQLCVSIVNIKPLAWVIIIGDSLHNLTDGLAVGVAISDSLSLGLSTATAILVHEIPHELSDYAILLHTGMTWYKALFLNFISALTSFVGFFIGVAIGTESKAANEWLLAVIAGQFLYIALVDLLPEVLHSREEGTQRAIQVVMTLIGLLTGFTILLLIALFEDSIHLSP